MGCVSNVYLHIFIKVCFPEYIRVMIDYMIAY